MNEHEPHPPEDTLRSSKILAATAVNATYNMCLMVILEEGWGDFINLSVGALAAAAAFRRFNIDFLGRNSQEVISQETEV